MLVKISGHLISIASPAALPGVPRRRWLAGDLPLENEDAHQRVDGECFDEGAADDHGRLDLGRRFGLATDRLHGAADSAAEPQGGAESGDPEAKRESESDGGTMIHERETPFPVRWAASTASCPLVMLLVREH